MIIVIFSRKSKTLEIGERILLNTRSQNNGTSALIFDIFL